MVLKKFKLRKHEKFQLKMKLQCQIDHHYHLSLLTTRCWALVSSQNQSANEINLL